MSFSSSSSSRDDVFSDPEGDTQKKNQEKGETFSVVTRRHFFPRSIPHNNAIKNERCHALCFPRHRADEDDRFLQQVRPFVSIIIALESLFISLFLRSLILL